MSWTKRYEDCDHETLVIACKNLYREGKEAEARVKELEVLEQFLDESDKGFTIGPPWRETFRRWKARDA